MSQLPDLLKDYRDQQGVTLLDRSRQRPLLMLFLRHAGCTFCRQALADLASARQSLEGSGTGLLLVFLDEESVAGPLAGKYGLGDLPRVCDTQQRLYEAFGLGRGEVTRVAGPAVWWRGLKAILEGHMVGVPRGDVTQMPGAFVVSQGEIVAAFRHATSADRPDYCELARSGTQRSSTGAPAPAG
ncbi:MAG: SelL-related redox protein [Planctomycetaceae bacterium]